MSESSNVFTPEEICAQARSNASASILTLLVLSRERGQPLTEAATLIGQIFAPSWDELVGQGALETASAAALNAVTCGAELRQVGGDVQRAEAVVAGWPSEEELAYFGLTRDEADTLNELYGPVAERLGLRFAWHRDGDAIVMTFEAPSS